MKLFNLSSTYLKNTATLTIGVIIAQIIPIVAYPILGRLYTPEDFGILAKLTSITAVITIIASLEYDYSIVIVRNKKTAANFVYAILLLSLVILSVISILMFCFSDTLTGLMNAADIKKWLWVCPVTAFCVVVFNCFNEWCINNSYFKSLAVNKIINGGSIPLSKIAFYFAKIRSAGLILGDLIGHIITSVSCVIRVVMMDRAAFKKISFPRMRYSLKRYSDCPKFVFPGQLLNKFGGELPVFFTMVYFSSEQLGYYSMATMILALPTTMISRAVRDTFKKTASDYFAKNGQCISFYRRLMFPMALISLIGFSIFYAIAPWVVTTILGDQWHTAAIFCRCLCPMIAINFVSEIASGMYIIAERMNLLLFWQIFYFVMTLGAMILGTMVFGDIISTLICLCVARSIVYLTDFYATYNLAKSGTVPFFGKHI